MYHIFLIHLSVDGHLGCFYVLAIVDSVAVNIRVHIIFEWKFCPDICPGVGLLDYMVVLYLVFWGAPIMSYIVVVPVYIPTHSMGGFYFSTPSPAFAICRMVNDGHSDHWEWYLTAVLICIYWIISDAEHFFHVLLANFMYSLERCLWGVRPINW